MSNLFTIPSDQCFVSRLAQGLWERVDGDPMALAEITVYLPTRRACRHLRESFLQITEARATLLPRMLPLGDVDEDDLDFSSMGALDDLLPAIPPLRRQMLLIKCIKQKDPALPLEQAASLAGALAALLDQVQTENCDLKDLKQLVPDDYSQHWQETLEFLEIILKVWPAVLEAEGCMDPADRRCQVLQKQTEAWLTHPPHAPIIAAGSTGSHPAVGKLMAAIATLPQGEVILPALDLSLDEDAWQAIEDTHPQFTMKQWLARSEFERQDVALWDGCESGLKPRVRLLQESMRPAAVTETWQDLNNDVIPLEAFDGLEALELSLAREEADVIALRLRAALEEKGKTAALVTPDRALASRVAAALERWGIQANDSAGSPLDQWSVGSFLISVIKVVEPEASPVDALSLLKHPLAAMGLGPKKCRRYARLIEMKCWRGVRPQGGWQGAANALEKAEPECSAWLGDIAKTFAPLTNNWFEQRSLEDWMDAHLLAAESFAGTDEETGAQKLWRGEDGEAAVAWLDEWRSAGLDLDPLSGAEYAALFTAFIRQVQVRPKYGQHPRISLLGPLEARLIHHDLIILGGLNEAVWPPAPAVDPWLSRPMKKAFGVPTPERRIGLSAHDFVQLTASSNVLLTRALRTGGSPTVPSRFWLQVDAVIQAAGYEPKDVLAPQELWRDWAALLDVANAQCPFAPPCPTPPVEARPNSLRVTEISTWMRNPYAIYAKHILKLKKLDDLDAEVSAADFGTVIHKALEDFVRATMTRWPENALDELLKSGQAAFAPFADRPQIIAFWWPRFEQMAKWFVSHEEKQRAIGVKPVAVETDATLNVADGAFTIRGRVDRIDRLADGSVSIVDYKTGAAPSEASVLAGYEPQLSLMAMMAAAGAFENLAAADIGALEYWAVGQRDDKDKIRSLTKDIHGQIKKAQSGLEQLVKAFADPTTPYEAEPKPKQSPRYNDYAHLSRMEEWGRTESGGS